jgi:hypothetical protein
MCSFGSSLAVPYHFRLSGWGALQSLSTTLFCAAFLHQAIAIDYNPLLVQHQPPPRARAIRFKLQGLMIPLWE